MAETDTSTADNEEKRKANPGVIVAICAAVVCVVCVIIAIIIGNNSTKNKLVGAWKHTEIDAVYIFSADGTCSSVVFDNERKCTYTDTGDILEIVYDGDSLASTYKYHIDEKGKTLHLENSFGQDVVYERQ